MIEDGVINRLVTYQTISAILPAANVTEIERVQDGPLPAMSYALIGRTKYKHLAGDSGLRVSRYTLRFYSQRARTRRAFAEALAGLEATQGTYAGELIKWISVEDERDGADTPKDLKNESDKWLEVDIAVWHKEV